MGWRIDMICKYVILTFQKSRIGACTMDVTTVNIFRNTVENNKQLQTRSEISLSLYEIFDNGQRCNIVLTKSYILQKITNLKC